MVKETKEHQDAEGRMGEKPHAPRTNPETTELSDPKQSGFDLDPSDGTAHDPPTETRSKPTKKKPKNVVYALQSKYDGLQKDVNTFQTKLDGLQNSHDDLQTKMDQMNANFEAFNTNFAQLVAKLSLSPTADIESKSKEATTYASEDSTTVTAIKSNSKDATTYAPGDPTADATMKEPTTIKSNSEDATTYAAKDSTTASTFKEPADDVNTKIGDATTYAPEDSTTVTTFKEPADDINPKFGDATSSISHKDPAHSELDSESKNQNRTAPPF